MQQDLAIHYLTHATFIFKDLAGCNTIAGFIAEACPSPKLAIIGLSEIFINALEHGNLGITYDEKTELQRENRWIQEIERRLKLPENTNKIVRVEFERLPNRLKIRVIDEGDGFDWRKYHDEKDDLLNTHGRGIPIAKRLVFSELHFIGKGNEVEGIIPL